MRQPQGELPLPHELASIAKIRASTLEDSAIQIAYLANDSQYDKVAEMCVTHRRTLDELAGAIAQLLPVAASPDAVKLPEPPSPYE